MAPSPFSRRGDGSTRPATLTRTPVEHVPLLALLEPDLRSRVRKKLGQRRVSAGKRLYRRGDAADDLFIVESGRLRVLVGDRVGHERVLRFVGPGDVVGEAAFMAESPHVTTAVAVETARVWRLTRADFDALLGRHEPTLRYLASVISERQTQANARLAAEAAPDESRSARGYVTAVYSPRGGAGVTTMAIALGIALAEQQPDDVVLMDLDVLFGHTLSNLWLQARGVLAQASPSTLQGLDRAGLDYYLLPHPSSLRVFPSAQRPEEGQSVTGDHVRAAVGTLRRYFGHVVLDLPHGFSDVALAGLEAADRVLVLATPEQSTLRDVIECRRIFSEVLRLAPDRLTFVLNHPLPYTLVPASDFAAATQTPWAEVPFGGDGPSAAALRGEALVTSRPSNPVSRAVVKLAHRVLAEAREGAALAGRPL
jgi:CRP-like cAMP-binding protein